MPRCPTPFDRPARLGILLMPLLAAACGATAPTQPQTASVSTAPPAARLAHRGDRVAVSIYEFRSSVHEIGARGATDMFKTALLANGRFMVVERARLNEGVLREKQLNAAGQSTGTIASKPLRAAEFIFEASITELSGGDRQTQGGINLGGLQIGGGSATDSLGIDVRIVDASSGEVRDALALRRPLRSSGAQVAGVGTLVQTLQAVSGRPVSPLVPDVNLQTSRKDNVDEALRGLIRDAVAQLAARF